MAAPTKSGRIEPTALYVRFPRDVRRHQAGPEPWWPTAPTCSPATENDRGHVQQFVDLLRRGAINSGGGLVLISHPSLTGIATKSRLSGSTQWHNAVRSRMVLSGVEKDDHDGREPINDMRVIKFHKNNYGPLSDELVLRWRNGVFVPVINTTVDQAERHQRAEEKVHGGTPHLFNRPGAGTSLPTEGRRDLCGCHDLQAPLGQGVPAAGDGGGPTSGCWTRDKIHILEDGPPSKRRKRILPGP